MSVRNNTLRRLPFLSFRFTSRLRLLGNQDVLIGKSQKRPYMRLRCVGPPTSGTFLLLNSLALPGV